MPASAEPSPVVVLFRKDLRLDDNHALCAAIAGARPVIALYIREPEKLGTGPLGRAQAWWLHHSLSALAEAIADRGGALLLRSGPALDVLAQIRQETGAETVFWNRRYDPHGMEIDRKLKATLPALGFTVSSFSGQLLHEPSRLKTGSGGPYRVYTPFWRALESSGEPPEPLDPPGRIPKPGNLPPSEPLDTWNLVARHPDWAKTFTEVWIPGEAAALERLETFVGQKLPGYGTARDVPAADATSLLSPHLALGEISPARIWHATRDRTATVPAEDVVKFRKELVWRDFCYHLLYHNPKLATENLNPRFDGFPWAFDAELFRLWTRGMTGYPIVDAGMRQLWRHGTMHNRVRMIAASFLIKDLLIDWRRGEEWFRDTLVDADPASNAASWQWVAGSGADAAPFFRIFNPVLQAERFDPEGAYVKRFVPELRNLDAHHIHRPFEAPAAALQRAGVTLGVTYPKPVVVHARARDRALALYTSTGNAT